MRLRTKISLALGAVFVACAAAALLLTLALENSASQILEITKSARPSMVNLDQMKRCHLRLHALVRRSLLSPADDANQRRLQTIHDELDLLYKNQQTLVEVIEGISGRVPYVSPELLRDQRNNCRDVTQLAGRIIQLAPRDIDQARSLYADQFSQLYGSLTSATSAVAARLDFLQRQHLMGVVSTVKRRTRLVAVVFVLIILAIFIITVAVNRYIVGQVRSLRGVAEEFASGNFAARAPDRCGDEFGELARTLNQMAKTIQNQTAALRQHADELQTRVDEKTGELKARAQLLEERNSQLRRANHQLAHLDDAKNEFVSMASHELRTPLTGMLGSLDVLLGGHSRVLAGDDRQLLEVCRRSTKRLVTLVDELLDLSRIDRGQLPIRPERVEIGGLAQEIIESFRMLARSRRVHIENAIPEGLSVWADRGKTAQILTNLLSNAVKFTSEGSVRVTAN
ncbi:MAG: histidine kinase dimerization/phospho-acceptor domain-containing protein, partial [Phycisphaerae bacterium]|nr:histidine kinase dimerization/phospho-acceptor domain-containing protein [Phycisphaerae bacterium]